MKKTTRPAQREEAVYYSDFSGKCFGEIPPIELKIEFGDGENQRLLSIHTHGSRFEGFKI
jgi:hypothetical protein